MENKKESWELLSDIIVRLEYYDIIRRSDDISNSFKDKNFNFILKLSKEYLKKIKP